MPGRGGMPPFSALDANGDGQLSPEELAAGQQRMRAGRSGAGPGKSRGMGRGGDRPSFATFDLNGDGRISEEEFLKAQGQRIAERSRAGYPMRNIGNIAVFADIDTNKDGAITPEEFAVHQRHHQRGGMR